MNNEGECNEGEVLPYGHWKKLTPDGIDYRKCPKHNCWRKKGKCEVCLLEQDKERKEIERKRQL